eukprot:359982-Chlamydomonas_euryale.AAC.3
MHGSEGTLCWGVGMCTSYCLDIAVTFSSQDSLSQGYDVSFNPSSALMRLWRYASLMNHVQCLKTFVYKWMNGWMDWVEEARVRSVGAPVKRSKRASYATLGDQLRHTTQGLNPGKPLHRPQNPTNSEPSRNPTALVTP